jgi:hypothetical protein
MLLAFELRRSLESTISVLSPLRPVLNLWLEPVLASHFKPPAGMDESVVTFSFPINDLDGQNWMISRMTSFAVRMGKLSTRHSYGYLDVLTMFAVGTFSTGSGSL